MARKLIRVTQEDIDQGERASARSCPIALAVRRGLKVRSHICVSVFETVYVEGVFDIETPPKAREFIDEFDLGLDPVKPFNFYLEVPQ